MATSPYILVNMATAEALERRGHAQRVRETERSRKAYEALADIGELPPIVNPGRRDSARRSLLGFLYTYFPHSTGLSPFGQDQLDAIERIEVALVEGGWVANVMPRGFTKSTITENSLLWALLYGYRKYALFFAGTAALAGSGINSISRELITNELLLQDFPEACYPFIRLEGKSQRAATQTYAGELTNLQLTKDSLRLANIRGFSGAGAIVEAYGILAPPRGSRYKDEHGYNVRPDVAALDDPSTDDSSRSEIQNANRLGYINNSISMMGGHGNEIAMICNATIINEGDLADQISDPTADHAWLSVRSAMVKQLPKQFEKMWLGEYAKIRRAYDRKDPRGKIKAKEASTEYLRANFHKMHEGGEVSWAHIGLEKTEISALQHAINIYIDKGPETFWSECQNKPLRPMSVASFDITEELAERFSGFERYVIPDTSSFLVFGIDVHDNILYYTVAAVQQDFTGWVVDYGTWPEQNVAHFTQRTAKQTMIKHYRLKKGTDNERAIELGVEDLVHNLLSYKWMTANGDPVPINAGFVDMGYKRAEARGAIRRNLPHSKIVLSSRGVGIGPTKRPMAEYDLSPKKIIRVGPDVNNPRWLIPVNEREGDVYGILFDANYWKDVTAARLVQNAKKARWELFGGRKTENHQHYVGHMMAEKSKLVTHEGRSVNVWEQQGSKDNHWWDTIVQCCVAASLCGATLPVASEAQHFIAEMKKVKKTEEDDFGDFFVTTRHD